MNEAPEMARARHTGRFPRFGLAPAVTVPSEANMSWSPRKLRGSRLWM